MTGFALGQIAIHEVEIATECTVIERNSIRCAFAAADKGAEFVAAEVGIVRANHPDRFALKRANGHADRIQYALFKLIARLIGHVLVVGFGNETCELTNLGIRQRIGIVMSHSELLKEGVVAGLMPDIDRIGQC